MKKRLLLFNMLFLLACGGISAQDIHFTQFNKAALNVNPAFTGDFYGTLRLNGIVREEARNIGLPFQTLNFSGEVNLPFAFRKQDWISGGLNMYRDKAGSLGQKMNMYAVSLAYHLAFDKTQNRYLSIGAQYGGGGITYDDKLLNGTDVVTASSLTGGNSSNLMELRQKVGGNSPSGGGSAMGSLNDVMAGVLYTGKSKSNIFRLGLSLEGLLKSDRAILNTNSDKKYFGFNINTEFTSRISNTSSWTMAGWLYNLGPANAWNVHGKYNFLLDPKKNTALSLGLGTRSLNSILFLVGMDIGELNVGLAYDWTISKLRNAGGYGGYELGVTYIYKHYKKPQPEPLIYCPRL